jgi:purine-binding chemotaxis protein CheW
VITASQICTFYIDKQMYGVNAHVVQEVIRYQEMTDVPLAPESVLGLINLRGQIVIAIDLRKRLGLPNRPEGKLPMNVLIKSDDAAISLLVDQIGDVQNFDEENFEAAPETLQGVSRQLIRGAYKMKDQILLLLDTERALNVTANVD